MLNQKYEHKQVEENKYQNWVDKGYFNANRPNLKPYSIVIPPPNVTGKLHIGHAWDNTLQDIISRYKRMNNYDMLYLPGMDHAGIATQAKVDARLKEQGTNRYELGREKFLEQAWNWKEEYAGHIREQWAKLGNSLDYTKERFTLDDGLNKAVNKVFVDLYNEGLIYRGERIINWDPQAKTALSNIEVIHQEIMGHMYTFNYQVENSDEAFAVSTTRPETMFGDVCVVVHPDDERYTHLIGKNAINPANGDIIPIIADSYIDIEFGTGAMKCTPAHDPNDYEIGKRHNLPRIKCMNEDGTMNEIANEFCGLDRFECRKKLTEKIKNDGNLIDIKEHLHQVGHSERTGVIIEPYLSKQWFVKMKPLAEEVLKNQKIEDQKINFYPERFERTFEQWLENIEDWCISRQLWWGHRIPAYYHKDTKEVYVGLTPPTDIENYIQDEDVLDTWFSSALWPFSTLGWPTESEDFNRFYPTSTMVTGYDIIFFWVARMAFQARYFTKQRPFKDCLIHGLIRDEQGRKMSKSLGNGIDPMDVIEQYGCDALRFFLSTNSTPGQDMRYITNKVEDSWNFINKLWNASRYVLMNIDETYVNRSININELSMIDTWIINRLNQVIEHTNKNMEKYEFALVGNELYNFAWNDFCSFYIEFSKAGLTSDNIELKHKTINTLVYVLKQIMKLLHPFMPFVTEEIYQMLYPENDSICIASWPEILEIDNTKASDVVQLIDIITLVRQIKTDNNLKPSASLDLIVKDLEDNTLNLDEEITSILSKMVKVTVVKVISNELMIRPIDNAKLVFDMTQIVNKEEEIKKLNKELNNLTNEINRGEKMLSNPNFTNKANPEKIKNEQDKLLNYKKQYEIVSKQINDLSK